MCVKELITRSKIKSLANHQQSRVKNSLIINIHIYYIRQIIKKLPRRRFFHIAPSWHLVVIKRLHLRYSIRDRYSNRGCARLVRALKRSWRVWRVSSLSGKVVGLRVSFLNAACDVTRWLVHSTSAPNRFPLLLLAFLFLSPSEFLYGRLIARRRIYDAVTPAYRHRRSAVASRSAISTESGNLMAAATHIEFSSPKLPTRYNEHKADVKTDVRPAG